MKRTILVSALLMVLSGLVAVTGCRAEPAGVTMPPLQRGPEAVMVEVTSDEFQQSQHISREAEVTYPGSLILSLSSNPTTGFQWSEAAQISDTSVLQQYSYAYVAPQETNPPVAGAAGIEVWTFKSGQKGTATVRLEYSRPWEGGERGVWTFDLTVTVK